jgi:6-phosphofructokinase 2
MNSIVTVTLNPALDKSCSVDHVVAERKLRCSEPSFDAGGGGLNVARAAHELGARVTAVFTSGGHTGHLLEKRVEDSGVTCRPVPVAARTRDNLGVYEESSGRQYRFGMPGAPLDKSELDACMGAIRELAPDTAYLVLSGSLPPGAGADAYARIARAVDGRCRVLVDTSGEAIVRVLEAPVFLIKPNVRELGNIAGRELEGDADVEAVSRDLIDEHDVEAVVTSLGSGGAVLVTADGCERVRAPTVKIRSKIGAGDSTVAGIVVGLSRGLGVSRAVSYGVAAGSAAVKTSGTQLCRRADVERLFEQMQDRRSDGGPS